MTTNKDINSKIHAYNADSVQHLDGLEHIRLRPTMYLGNVSGTPNHLFEEALMNSLDEYEEDVAKNIIIHLYKDDSISITDDGRGMPPLYAKKFKMPTMRALLTLINTGKSFQSSGASSSQHGVGMKAAMATSDWFKVKSWRDGYEYYDEYKTVDNKPGIPQVELKKDKNGVPQLPRKKFKKTEFTFEHGTEVHFKPSDDVWGNPVFDWKQIKKLAKDEAYIHPGLTIRLINDKNGDNEVYNIAGGPIQLIKDIVKEEHRELLTPIFEYSGIYETNDKLKNGENSKIEAQVTFAWTKDNSVKSVLFTNGVPNSLGGTPVKGFNIGIARLLNKYAKDFSLSKTTIEQRDLLPGLITVIVMKDPLPQFDGQTKKEITSNNAKNALNNITYNDAQLQTDRAIEEIKLVIKEAIKRANERKKIADSSVNLNTKAITNRVNKKLSSAKKLGLDAELFLVEGDSAAGTLINERDNKFQAIMPLRGKVLNTFKATVADSMANMELNTIFAALGTGVGKDFNIKKLKYGKVIIATDADPDGAHIADLILTAIIKFTPQLLLDGRIYRSVSPLYINQVKEKNKVVEKYVYTEEEQEQFLQKTAKSKIVHVNRNKGLGELNDNQVQKIIINPQTRKLLQYHIDEDNIGDAYEMMDIYMGRNPEERRKIFSDPNLFTSSDVE